MERNSKTLRTEVGRDAQKHNIYSLIIRTGNNSCTILEMLSFFKFHIWYNPDSQSINKAWWQKDSDWKVEPHLVIESLPETIKFAL